MIKIGILGNGTVGGGVVELIERNRGSIKERTGRDVDVSRILVKNLEKHKQNAHFSLITNRPEEFFGSDMDIVVELIGGEDPAYDYIKKALKANKHVVTANKNVISKHGIELTEIAKEHGVALLFEASVGGGMPIIKVLSEGLNGSNIDGITGILNGTTNFILSKMDGENMDYASALKIAQELGFAEADPSADVLGYDAARKLAITSSISYGEIINWEKINIQGISEIDEIDMKCAKEFGATIKLLAISKRIGKKIYAAVKPVIVSKASSLGKIQNEFNGVILEGDATGEIFLSGKGAGKLPTASAVMGDILSIVDSTNNKWIPLGFSEAQLETTYKEKASWLLRIKASNRASAIDNLLINFKRVYLFNNKGHDEDEIIAFVESQNETMIDDICKDKNILALKKTLALFDFNY